MAACCCLELGGGPVAALGQRGLEVRGGLGGVGPLLLEDGLALLPQRGGVALGRVALLVGGPPGVGEDPGGLGVGVAAALVGVLVGFVADGDGGLVGELAGVLGLGLGPLAQLPGLLVGEREDLADALAEVAVAGRLGGTGLAPGAGLLPPVSNSAADASASAARCCSPEITRSTSAGS